MDAGPAALRFNGRIPGAATRGASLQHGRCRQIRGERAGKGFGADKRQVVGGGVVLGIVAPGGAGQDADGQVEARGAVLPFVVAEGEEVLGDEILAESGEGGQDGAVDLAVAAAALLVVEGAPVAQIGRDQAVAEGVQALAVPGQPGDGADAARGEQEAIAVAALVYPGEGLGQVDRDRDPREVVVGELRMADVARDEDLFGGLPRQQALAPGHRAVLERGVDEDLVLAARQGFEESMGQAEAPGFLVVGGAVRDQVRLFRQAVQVGPAASSSVIRRWTGTL